MQPKLMKFMARCNSEDNIRIAESKDYIEIIVAHQSYSNSDGETFSGGAEQYILDKKNRRD